MRNLVVIVLAAGMVLQAGYADARKKKGKKRRVQEAPLIEEIGPDDDFVPIGDQPIPPAEEAGSEGAAASSKDSAGGTGDATAVTTEADVGVEDETPAEVDAEAAEEEEATDKPKTDTKLPVGPIILGSLGAVVTLVGAGVGWQADEEYDLYNTQIDNGYPNASEALIDDIQLHTAVANGLMITGAVIMVGAVVWGVVDWVMGKKKKESAEAALAVKWRPVVGPTQAGAVVTF